MESGDAAQPVLPFPHHHHGVLEQLRRGRLRSRRQPWRRRRRTGRTAAGRGEFHAAFRVDRPHLHQPVEDDRDEAGDDRRQITDPFPAPVAPTIRTWWPTSCSRHTVPSSASATGIPAVRQSGGGSNGGTRSSSGSLIRNHSSTRCRRLRTVRTRQSSAPKVCASRSATCGVVLDRLAGQHPHPHPIHRPGRPHPQQRRDVVGAVALDQSARRCPSPSSTAAGRPSRPATTTASANAPGPRTRPATAPATRPARPPGRRRR